MLRLESLIFVLANADKKYADGLGKLQNYESLFIESSSDITQENVNHTLEDTLKLICECNGALFYILSQFIKCSFETALQRSTFGVQVIKNILTLSKMSLKDESQWKFVELRSAIVPTKWGDRFEWVTMFELLASLYLELIEQEQVIMDIKKENSGLGYVAAEDTFSARLNMHQINKRTCFIILFLNFMHFMFSDTKVFFSLYIIIDKNKTIPFSYINV
jgi:hypothetical protein